ncbi:MAG TPA: hypothetical protein VN541_10245, partial [Tepidisphaeraceae bacterium]|nr:hypothetical protein [Tepidisphaeraceae bacterium]
VLASATAAVLSCVSPLRAAPATQPADGQTDVPVKEVVLYSSGVGYFEHFGQVNGDAATVLHFKTDQINDILKSLVLEDMDGGKVAAVTYPSQGPLEHTLKSFQIDLTSNPPLAELLNQLRGAQVTINRADGGAPLEGTILGVEKQQRPSGDKDHQLMDVWILNLVGDSGIQPVELNRVGDVKLQDPELRKELSAALAALAQARDKDKKPVEIHFDGQGERRVRIGYVVETPVWKTSYRLILLDKNDQQNRGSIQGWAVVENQTDSDWKDVQLSLVSGRPISFIEDLYQPLYIPRPVVKPELYASLMPQTYAGGLTQLAVGKMETLQEGEALAPAAAAPQMLARRMAGENDLRDSLAASDRGRLASINPTSSVASIASAAKVGEFFQYTVGSVTLARQQSAMLPIVTDSVQAERLSIYNQGVLPNNPLLGARIKNTTDKYLMQGPITVLQGGSYAGDANIEDLPPGQQRLISFGVDQEVTVNATNNTQTRDLMTGRIVKGVLELTYKQTFNQDYTAEDKSDSPRMLVIEAPRHQGWELLEPKKPQESTDTLYRFEGKLEPHKASKLTVREQHVDLQRFEILPLDLQAVVSFVHTGRMPQDVRDALSRAAQLKSDLVNLQRQTQETQQKVNQISQEQTRIRENMKAVNPSSAYYKRLLQELDDQETQIQDLHKRIDDLQKQQEQKRKVLGDYLGNLNVG